MLLIVETKVFGSDRNCSSRYTDSSVLEEPTCDEWQETATNQRDEFAFCRTGKKAVLFKMEDDLRQDALILQMCRYLDEAFKAAGFDLNLIFYDILPTGPREGLPNKHRCCNLYIHVTMLIFLSQVLWNGSMVQFLYPKLCETMRPRPKYSKRSI